MISSSVSLANNVIFVTADVDDLEESESSAPGQGTHKWIGLVIIGKLLTSVGTIMTWAPKIVSSVWLPTAGFPPTRRIKGPASMGRSNITRN